jgi:hypothetical protein
MKDIINKLEKSNNQVGEVINIEKITKKCRNLDPQELMALLKSGRAVFMSWGPSNFTVDNQRNCRMFRMTVQGHHHQGHVYIFVNGMDLFDVYLTTSQGTIKDKTDDMGLYFDQLIDWIDRKIERIPIYKD